MKKVSRYAARVPRHGGDGRCDATRRSGVHRGVDAADGLERDAMLGRRFELKNQVAE